MEENESSFKAVQFKLFFDTKSVCGFRMFRTGIIEWVKEKLIFVSFSLLAMKIKLRLRLLKCIFRLKNLVNLISITKYLATFTLTFEFYSTF